MPFPRHVPPKLRRFTRSLRRADQNGPVSEHSAAGRSSGVHASRFAGRRMSVGSTASRSSPERKPVARNAKMMRQGSAAPWPWPLAVVHSVRISKEALNGSALGLQHSDPARFSTVPRVTDGGSGTRPPVAILRHPTPQALFAAIPQIAQIVRRTPQDGEAVLDFLIRLRGSSTPEEAVSFTAFAVQPKMAIWWGYECLRGLPQRLDAADRAMLEAVAIWTQHPSDANR